MIENGISDLPPAADFSALDPTLDEMRFRAKTREIAGIALAARREARRVRATAFGSLVAWSRYTIAAAAAVLILAGSALIAVPAPANAAPPQSLVESAGIPASVVAIAAAQRPVAATELVDVFDRMTVSPAGH